MQLHLFEVVFEFDSARLLALAAEFSPYVLLADLVEYEVPPLADDDNELTTLQQSVTHSSNRHNKIGKVTHTKQDPIPITFTQIRFHDANICTSLTKQGNSLLSINC